MSAGSISRQGGATAIAFAISLAMAASASAATFTVNTTKDGVDANIADAVCATAKGTCTLRAAIDEANEEPGDDEIKLPKGTIKLKRPVDTNLEDNSEGDLDITEQVLIDGRSPRKTVIKQTRGDRVLRNSAPFSVFTPVEVSDLTLTGGRVGGAGEQGGAGFQNGGFAILTRVSVRGNLTRADAVDGLPGGGVWSEGILGLSESTVRGNTVRAVGDAEAEGAGVIVVDGGAGIQDGSRIVGNSAELRNPEGSARARAGGLYVENPGGQPEDTVTVTDSTIANNTALGGPLSDAGGIAALSGANLTVTRSTISGNGSRLGGGLYAVGADDVNIDVSTFSGNRATQGGGAIFQQLGAGGLDLDYVTVAGNRSAAGESAIDSQQSSVGAVELFAAILSNPGTECGGPANSITSVGRNIVGDMSCDFNSAGFDLLANPGLKPLGDYGGPTRTHMPRGSSPAIGRGGPCIGPDQRGITRPQGADCDVGAVEKVVAP